MKTKLNDSVSKGDVIYNETEIRPGLFLLEMRRSMQARVSWWLVVEDKPHRELNTLWKSSHPDADQILVPHGRVTKKSYGYRRMEYRPYYYKIDVKITMKDNEKFLVEQLQYFAELDYDQRHSSDISS